MAPLLDATRSAPIVFVVVIDPVGAGFVASLAQPGGDTNPVHDVRIRRRGKWLELLKEIAPRVTRAAVLGRGEPCAVTTDLNEIASEFSKTITFGIALEG